MKLLKLSFLSIILLSGLLHSTFISANCSDTSLSCLDRQVINAIEKALIKHQVPRKDITDISGTLEKFLKNKGVFDKYYKDCWLEDARSDNDPRDCFGSLDRHIVKELWDIDFDYSSADVEQRIEFLKKIGVKLQ